MRQLVWILSLYCVTSLLSHVIAQDDADAASRRRELDEIVQLLKTGKNDEAKMRATAFSVKHDLDATMSLYKRRVKGGLGIGSPAAPIEPNGIEHAIAQIAIERISADTVLAKRKDFEEMAWRMVALAKITERYAADLKIEKWRNLYLQWSKDATTAAIDFQSTIRGNDSKAIVKAADRVRTTCNPCHSLWDR